MSSAASDNSPRLAIEICSSMLHVAIVRHRPQGEWEAQVQSALWKKRATSLHSPVGVAELSEAVRSILSQHRLHGAKATFVLNGAFCVTRVIRDTADRVRREIAELEERCQNYLALGPGPKALAASIRQVDARHQHALATVCNQATLDAVVTAAAAAGVKLERIEPSLVALCRLVGRLESDGEPPSAIIHLDERGAELGLAHQGELLLDFRPGGKGERHNAADLVKQHLERLQRYCQRHFSLEFGGLRRVYLCGPTAIVDQVRSGLAGHGQLTPEPIDVARFDPQGLTHKNGAPPAAAIGACLTARDGARLAAAPNLLDRSSALHRNELSRSLIQYLLPVAAMLLVAAGLAVGNLIQNRACRELEDQLAAMAPVQARARELRLTLERSETKLAHLKRIATQLKSPAWRDLVTTVGHCLPPDVWLDRIVVDERGQMTLAGSSFAETGIYEFVDGMKNLPDVADVALKSTHPGGSLLGPVTNFDVECKYTGQGNLGAEGVHYD